MRRFVSFLAKQHQHQLLIGSANRPAQSAALISRPGGLWNQLNQQQLQPFSCSPARYLFGKTPGNSTSGPNQRDKAGKGSAKSGRGRKQDNQANQRNRSPASEPADSHSRPDYYARQPKQQRNSTTGSRTKSNSNRTNTASASSSSSGNQNKMSANSVKHDKNRHQFTLNLGDRMEARIDYKPLTGNKIEMYHTEVPVELRNRGIGRALAKGALERACQEKLKVKLTCSYLINYLDKFADQKLKSLVEK